MPSLPWQRNSDSLLIWQFTGWTLSIAIAHTNKWTEKLSLLLTDSDAHHRHYCLFAKSNRSWISCYLFLFIACLYFGMRFNSTAVDGLRWVMILNFVIKLKISLTPKILVNRKRREWFSSRCGQLLRLDAQCGQKQLYRSNINVPKIVHCSLVSIKGCYEIFMTIIKQK